MSIEHYFPIEFLKKNNMVKETPILDVFEITGNKTDFATLIQQEKEEEVFKYFPVLLRSIDEICGQDINYIE